ncbi:MULTISPECIES: EamA family transporter [Pseudomonas]|uniref:EamA family transporter n=2 Tax=Pseudomonas TaxID=286 RepID=A0A921NJJ8_9PSED|nr:MULTISPECIES: EamA family transporter [Pseudomonas]MBV4479151.1 EamA family transporter [Pseudomonas khavaziana]HJH20828.1 EamA family transporter [Pseudomonas lactis]
MTYLLAIVCVIGIAAGQILFKMSSSSLSKSGSWFDMQTLTVLFSAFALYGLTTILWVYVLQRADLGKIYPLMALAFVIVPIGSHFVFGERFQPQYMVGVALIIVGIVVTVKA